VLGPLDVAVDGRAVSVAAPKQRALLGVLVAAEGAPVAVGRLVEELWDAGPPPTAVAALQVHVSGLRKVLGSRLRTDPNGYQLDATVDEVDFRRFTASCQRPDPAPADLAAALALWRGEAFEGVPAGSAAQVALAEVVDGLLDGDPS